MLTVTSFLTVKHCRKPTTEGALNDNVDSLEPLASEKISESVLRNVKNTHTWMVGLHDDTSHKDIC